MCSIIGSFSRTKLEELIKLNSSRGNFSYSFTVINPQRLNNHTVKNLGEFDFKLLDSPGIVNQYKLVHIQAPTGLNPSEKTIHPATYDEYKLWHNGILQPKEIEKLQKELETSATWDTELLLRKLTCNSLSSASSVLSEIEGSFACVLLKQSKYMKLFRTTSAPLFIDRYLNISSVIFEGAQLISAGKIYRVNFESSMVEPTGTFTSKDNPYFFA